MDQIYYCYRATNTVNRKSYIGFATNPQQRWREHKRDADKGRGYVFHEAIRKHGWNAFEFEVLCCGKDKRAMLEYVEPALIDQYQSSIGKNGYNMHRVVIGASGRKDDKRKSRTPEQKAIISKKTREAMASPEVREQLSKSVKAFYANGGQPPMKGKKHSDESKAKMSETTSAMVTDAQREQCRQMSLAQWNDPELRLKAMERNKRSESSRQKMSNAKKSRPSWNKGKANTWTAGHRSKIYIVTTPSNEELTVTNLTLFARENGLSQGTLHMTSTGQRKAHKGYRCRLI
jgi:group I intron endonuclease